MWIVDEYFEFNSHLTNVDEIEALLKSRTQKQSCTVTLQKILNEMNAVPDKDVFLIGCTNHPEDVSKTQFILI